MNSTKIFVYLLVFILSLNGIFCDEVRSIEADIFENGEAEVIGEDFVSSSNDIETIWGAINPDSVRVGSTFGFTRNDSIGTIATWNVTIRVPRIMDGIRLTNVNNTGVGDIVDGGIGYNYAAFMLVGHSNHFRFIIEAFENYSSSLLPAPTTTPIPETIIEEWGTINYASRIIYPRQSIHIVSDPGKILTYIFNVSSTKPIDGIRVTSFEHSIESAEIIEGGIGFDSIRIKLIAKAENISCLVENYENGTFTTALPTTTTNLPITTTNLLTTTTNLPTTLNPGDVKEWGDINNETKLAEKRFENYPQPGFTAEGNSTLEISGTILGMRLKSLNNTNGLWDLTDGGLNKSFVTFNFKGAGVGRPYDFNLEIFGNSAAAIKMSMILIILSTFVFALFK